MKNSNNNDGKPSQETLEKIKTMRKRIELIISSRTKGIGQRRLRPLNINRKLNTFPDVELEQKHIESTLHAKRIKMNVNDYELIKIISKGKFSELRIVRSRFDDIIYTMKAINKQEIICKNRVSYIGSSRDLMVDTDYSFILKLQYSFQDDIYKYLVMEYCRCDLMYILMQQNILTETQTRFYMAELTVAINAIHEIDYVQRDLKPNNILISNEGHIKLSDYDIAKSHITENDEIIQKYQKMKDTIKIQENVDTQHKNDRDSKLIGTPYYIAPEVFGQKGYDKMVDWWSMGIIMFECLMGYTPFYHQGDNLQTCKKIVHYRKSFKIPQDAKLSAESVDLLRNLICSHRRRYWFDKIKKHAFFKEIEWNNLKMMKAPFIPMIIDKIEIFIFGYMRIMQQKLKLLYDVPYDIVKLIVLIHGSDMRYQELKISTNMNSKLDSS